jgi:hypothetical protein
MKKLKVFASVLVILCAVSVAIAGENISGIWVQRNPMSGVANEHFLIAQSGSNITVVVYFEFNGAPYVYYGLGTAKDNTFEFSYKYSKNPTPGVTTSGRQVMSLSADGKLIGKWSDDYGNSGNSVYVKQK